MNIATLLPDDEFKEGKWFEYDGAHFFIVPQGKEFDRAIIRATRSANPTELRKKPEMMQDFTTAAIADTVLKNWKGVKNGADDFLPTRENKIRLLGIREFREWVSEVSTNVAQFKREALASDAADLKSGT